MRERKECLKTKEIRVQAAIKDREKKKIQEERRVEEKNEFSIGKKSRGNKFQVRN